MTTGQSKSPRQKLSQLRRQFGRYYHFFLWVCADVFWRYRARITALVLADMLGLAGQAGALFVVYSYARALETGSALELLEWQADPRSSATVLVAASVPALLLLLSSSFLIHRARVATIRLWREYTDFCTQRAFVVASALPSALSPDASTELTPENMARLTQTDARSCGLIVRVALNALLPMGTFLAAGTVIFFVNPWLSLIVAIAMGFASNLYYRVSVAGAKFRAELERHGAAAAGERKRLLRRLGHLAAGVGPEDRELREMFQSGKNALRGHAMEGQRRVLDTSNHISSVAMAVALFGIFLVRGTEILSAEANWSALLAYLVVFRFFASNLLSTARALTSINRFYPSARRYARFVEDAQRAVESGEPEPRAQPADYNIIVRVPDLDGAARRLELAPGERAALVLRDRLTRYDMAALIEVLEVDPTAARKGVLHKVWFATDWAGPSFASLRECFGLPGSWSWQTLCQEFEEIGLKEVAEQHVPRNLDQPLSERQWRKIDPCVSFCLSVFAGIATDCRIIILDSCGLRRLPQRSAERILERLSDCVVFLSYRGISDEMGRYGEQAALLSDGAKIIAWGATETVRQDVRKVETLLGAPPTRASRREEAEGFDVDVDRGMADG